MQPFPAIHAAQYAKVLRFGHSCKHANSKGTRRDSRGNVGLDTFVSDLALDVDIQKVGGNHFDVFAADMILVSTCKKHERDLNMKINTHLIWTEHMFVKDFDRDFINQWVRDPSAWTRDK